MYHVLRTDQRSKRNICHDWLKPDPTWRTPTRITFLQTPKRRVCSKDLQGLLIHNKVMWTIFGHSSAFFCSNPIRTLFWGCIAALVKCPGENKPATRAQFPARAQFSTTRAQFQKACKAKDLPRSPCVCMYHHLFATEARANICVSICREISFGPAHFESICFHKPERRTEPFAEDSLELPNRCYLPGGFWQPHLREQVDKDKMFFH